MAVCGFAKLVWATDGKGWFGVGSGEGFPVIAPWISKFKKVQPIAPFVLGGRIAGRAAPASQAETAF